MASLSAAGVISAAAAEFGIPTSFPAAVRRAAESAPATVPASAAGRGRLDITDLPLVTIDGADARDFDDAVYAEARGGEFRLIVAIADVSHYIAAQSETDIEAQSRGNSVYLPDRVAPMLPPAYSAGVCSLKPDARRLCLAVEAFVGKDGNIHRYRFFRALMRSHCRFTYEEAAEVMAGQTPHPLRARLLDLRELFLRLFDARLRRGAFDLELAETRIEVEGRRIADVSRRMRTEAHRVIEECMLCANTCAADYLSARRMPTLYRVHDAPPPDDIRALAAALRGFGASLSHAPRPADIKTALNSAAGRDPLLARTLPMLALRALPRARYDPKCAPHYGLALERYLHFTSPIRRYPDLLAHRAIIAAMSGRPPPPSDSLESLGRHFTETEMRADKAGRAAAGRLCALFMRGREGEEFDAVVVHIAAFGMFVAIEPHGIEGLLRIPGLRRDYAFDPRQLRLRGRRNDQEFALGAPLRVKLARVDLENFRLDFVLA